MHGTSSLPLCNCHLSPVEGSVSGTSMKRQGCRGSQTLQRMGENSVPMGDVHNNSKGIKLSLLRQKMSILYLSQKKKISLIWSSFLEGCRTPPCLLHPSCGRQMPKSITLTTPCITVIAWVRLAIFVTITKADSHRLAWSSLFKTVISEGYLL